MAVRKRRDDEISPLDNVIEAPIVQRQVTVSDALRLRRIECGLDISHVAEVLRIRPAVLTAIEEGNFHLLPGPAYAIGFVRSYATYLGMDAETIVPRFKAEAAGVSHRPHLHFPLPIRDSRVPTGPLIVICVLLAVLTYAGWYYFNARPGQLTDIVPEVPDRLHRLLDPPRPRAPAPREAAEAQPEAVLPAPVTQAVPLVATPTAPQPNPGQPAAGSAPGSASMPATAGTAGGDGSPQAVDGVPPVEDRLAGTAPPGPSPAPDLAQPAMGASDQPAAPATAYGAPEGQSRVVLRATADSWVQVRDKAGNLLFTRVLKPGEHYNVPNTAGLTLIAGNAGALDVAVDGVGVQRIGELGHVARNVSLDPDHLLAGRPHAN
jgi:cytoskeleton protein RodZ